jgi:hypothetical protein
MNWQESWDRMEEAERRNRDIGAHRQLEGESLVEAARERKAMTDEQLMRETLEAFRDMRTSFKALLTQIIRERGADLQVENQKEVSRSQAVIAKLEERLLNE